jgi:hypothetical protein
MYGHLLYSSIFQHNSNVLCVHKKVGRFGLLKLAPEHSLRADVSGIPILQVGLVKGVVMHACMATPAHAFFLLHLFSIAERM